MGPGMNLYREVERLQQIAAIRGRQALRPGVQYIPALALSFQKRKRIEQLRGSRPRPEPEADGKGRPGWGEGSLVQGRQGRLELPGAKTAE